MEFFEVSAADYAGSGRSYYQLAISFFFFFWLQEASPLLLSWILTISLLFTVFTLSGTSVCWVVDVIPIGLSGLF